MPAISFKRRYITKKSIELGIGNILPVQEIDRAEHFRRNARIDLIL
ncbi:MAG: hypothetical protein LBS22_01070 [Puniceicoccales bacterium]|nr:hypothetical protein [Puniceicoccales bacterium]